MDPIGGTCNELPTSRRDSVTSGTAIIIGAGPAGLTAAIELQRQTGIKPIVIEASNYVGGISRTVQYKGNRMDIGGHRFFSKSDRVMRWWMEMMPVEASTSTDGQLAYQGQRRDIPSSSKPPDPQTEDLVMLVRHRKSRIYFLRRFFDYPIHLTADTLKKMGMVRTMRAGISYMRSALLPQREERTLEDFFINRFGNQLYLTFFKSYTEKVWGFRATKSALSGVRSASRACRLWAWPSTILRRHLRPVVQKALPKKKLKHL